MNEGLLGVVCRFAAFAVVCVLAGFAMIAVFGEARFATENTYKAEFVSVTGLEKGNFVRIAGVEVGKVTDIAIHNNATALVEFSTDDTVVLTEGTGAAVRYENLVGARYLALEEGTGGVRILQPGEMIPLARTAPALDLDALIGGFKPLFRALKPEQVNELTGQLIQAFQGQDAVLGSLLDQTAALTSTLADRDELIGQVITNLNTVLGSLKDHSSQFDQAVSSLSDLIAGLSQRKQDIANSVAYTNAASGTIADLLVQAREPLKNLVHQTDRTSSQVLADRDFVDELLRTLPEAYEPLARQGLYGDFFNFYTCEVLLKVNGKGGQPVYVRIANQVTGRCAPK